MKYWQKILISPELSIKETLKIIDLTALQIALVIDENQKLLGTVTDGDVRRAILRGISLEDSVSKIMNTKPTKVLPHLTDEEILALMRRTNFHQIPVVEDSGKVIRLVTLDSLLQKTSAKKDNWVILMVGGLGTRLAPLTKDIPKPLLKIGGKPILENILESFLEQGFHRFFLSVNYKAEMIEAYFGDGKKWGCEIEYLREKERLGTAGSLKLLPDIPNVPFFVMNGDILTKVNYLNMLNFHENHQSVATMAVREYDIEVPFGVVKTDNHLITDIVEKPSYSFYVNAGIYLLNPSCLDLIPQNHFYDMPSLFEKLLEKQQIAVSFPVWEYWLDIGRISDFEKANQEFGQVFS